jgi:hypothetical protein
MRGRLRQLLDTLVFAGLKPGVPASQPKKLRFLDRLRSPLERLLARGAAPSDPLYLTNRSPAQKTLRAVLLTLPLVLICGGVAYVVATRTPADSGPKDLSRSEIAKRVLPGLAKNIELANADVQVLEAVIRHEGGHSVSGSVRNNTGRTIHSADLVFTLTNAAGSQLGGVATTVRDLAPGATRRFEFTVKEQDAAFAIVREVVAR